MDVIWLMVMTKIRYLIPAFLLASFSINLFAEACKDTADGSLISKELYWQRLDEIRSEKDYPVDVLRGTFEAHHQMEAYDTTFHYMVDVPEEYDPKRKMDLHVYLHGGVKYSSNIISKVKMRRLKKQRVDGAISVYPSAWTGAKWWYESQSQNIVEIIKIIKESYNVDENRIFLHGLSDGGGGVYYFASHLPTPFAGFIALIGSPHVLRPKHRVFGTTFPANFVNKPIFAVNAQEDEFFPSESVERLFESLNKAGGDITFHEVKGDHFGTPWLVKKKKEYESFIAKYTRNPYPDTLYWQIDEGEEFNRIHWLILSGAKGGDAESAVVANKKGNTVHLGAKNVSAVTLLISSDHFDLSRNIQVWSNEKLVFDQAVVPDARVLEKWFEADRDRSMLFAYEICLDAL
jgi:dienelactone hydrolase